MIDGKRGKLAAAHLVFLILLGCGGCASDEPARYFIHEHYGVHDPQFARVMGDLLGAPPVRGNSCQTLLNGKPGTFAPLDVRIGRMM